MTIGLVYKQRVIPLVWMIYKGKKGHSSADKQIELLTQVRDLLPKGAKVIRTMVEARKKITIKLFGSISQEERQQYLNILTTVHSNLVESSSGA